MIISNLGAAFGSLGKTGGEGPTNHITELFCAPINAPDDEIEKEGGVICPKSERGTPGTCDYKYNREAATASLPHPFGVAKHFVSSLEGESEEGNATKEQYVQDTYIINLAKVEDLETRLIQYDMKNSFMVADLKPNVKPESVLHVTDLWQAEVIHDLIKDWEKIDWKTICYWQYSINKW